MPNDKPLTPEATRAELDEIRLRRQKLSTDRLAVDDHIVNAGDTPGKHHVYDFYEDDPPLVTNFATADDAAFFAHAPVDINFLLDLITTREAQDASRWHPIATAPKDGTEVLLLGRNGLRDVGRWFECGNNEPGFFAVHAVKWEPTHWMPLPPPPTDGEG